MKNTEEEEILYLELRNTLSALYDNLMASVHLSVDLGEFDCAAELLGSAGPISEVVGTRNLAPDDKSAAAE